MRLLLYAFCIGLAAFVARGAEAADKPPPKGPGTGHIEVTADDSLEWYQDKRLYVARGNAKAVRGDLTVEADVLTAHEREAPPKGAKANAPENAPENAPASEAATPTGDSGTGDIDKMTAEGHVHVSTPKSNIYGQHGVYDLVQHVTYVTGDDLKYQTEEETVTAKQSLEYWENKKIAVARGNAVAVHGDRHVEGDVLTAKFRDLPNGKSEIHTMRADGHVVVITHNDISRGDRAVYDLNRNIAIITGHVRITRPDGMQLSGDVGEVDFATNQSRLLNQGKGTRVRALLTDKSGPKKAAAVPAAP